VPRPRSLHQAGAFQFVQCALGGDARDAVALGQLQLAGHRRVGGIGAVEDALPEVEEDLVIAGQAWHGGLQCVE